MKKMLFVRTSTPARGDKSGPTFEEGKAYWMRNDSAAYWMSEGAAVEAPHDMGTVNDPPPEKRFAESVRIVPSRPGRFNVLVAGVLANDQPLSAGAAEELRRDIIAGVVAPPQPASPPAPVVEPGPVEQDEDDPDGDPEADDEAPDDDAGAEDEGGSDLKPVHLGFGRYNVEDAAGNRRNDAPLSKKAAQALIDDLRSGD